MEIRKSKMLDDFVYVLACILSLGSLWVLRIVISQAIRMAIDND